MTLVRKYFVHGMIASILLGALFAFLGVYNTNTQPYFHRFVFWFSTMFVGNFATGVFAPMVFLKWLPKRPLVLQLSFVAVLISFPVTLVIAAYDHNYGLDWSFYIWLLQYRYVVVISAILVFVGYFILRPYIESQTSEGEQPDSTDNGKIASQHVEQQFLKRLAPKHQRATLIAIKSEDHYLRVFTDVGDELILMRLSDAISVLAGADGMQTHRSWWVANHAISDMTRKQGKLVIQCHNELEVPVSRTYEKHVKLKLNQ